MKGNAERFMIERMLDEADSAANKNDVRYTAEDVFRRIRKRKVSLCRVPTPTPKTQ